MAIKKSTQDVPRNEWGMTEGAQDFFKRQAVYKTISMVVFFLFLAGYSLFR